MDLLKAVLSLRASYLNSNNSVTSGLTKGKRRGRAGRLAMRRPMTKLKDCHRRGDRLTSPGRISGAPGGKRPYAAQRKPNGEFGSIDVGRASSDRRGRRPRRAHGGGDSGDARPSRPRLRRRALAGAKIPARRARRPQPHAQRAVRAFHVALRRGGGAAAPGDRAPLAGRAARLERRARRGDLRRRQRPRLPPELQGDAAAARLAEAPRGARGRAQSAPPLRRLRRRPDPAFRFARGRRGGRSGGRRPRARRRLLAAARRRRLMGRDSCARRELRSRSCAPPIAASRSTGRPAFANASPASR